MFFREVLLEIVNGDVEPRLEIDPAFIDGIFILVTQGDKHEVPFEIRKGQAGRPANGFQRRLAAHFNCSAMARKDAFEGAL